MDVAEQVGEALLTMHRHGYVHLDVKVGPTFLHSPMSGEYVTLCLSLSFVQQFISRTLGWLRLPPCQRSCCRVPDAFNSVPVTQLSS